MYNNISQQRFLFAYSRDVQNISFSEHCHMGLVHVSLQIIVPAPEHVYVYFK
jgi:hypothetical protein